MSYYKTTSSLTYKPVNRINDAVKPFNQISTHNVINTESMPVNIRFSSTYESSFKNISVCHQEPILKAPSVNRIHYLSEFHKYKPKKHGWYRPLDPSHQKSESFDEYSIRNSTLSAIPFTKFKQHKDIAEFDFSNEKCSDLKQNLDSKKVSKGKVFHPKDLEVLRLLDPYMTTKEKEHRLWTEDELKNVAKCDIATYWDSEEVSTIKSKLPLPKEINLDNIFYNDNPKINGLISVKQRTPVRSNMSRYPLHSTYSESYTPQRSELRKLNANFGLSSPFNISTSLRTPAVQTNMYETESNTIGKLSTVYV